MSARGYVFNKFDSEDYDDITPTSPIMIKTDIFGAIVTGKENLGLKYEQNGKFFIFFHC